MMQQTPHSPALISVIMPAYNAQAHLTDSVQSVLNQTYQHIELLIINDGSTDQTEQLAHSLAISDRRIRVFSQQNQGVSATRNRGILEAQGEFICFIDSDDAYHPQQLEKLYQKQVQTDAEAVYCGNQNIYLDKVKQHNSQFNQDNLLYHYLMQDTLFHLGCFLIQKSLVIDNTLFFTPHLRLGEDIAFLSHLMCLTEPQPVAEYLYQYRYNPNSVMNSHFSVKDYLDEISAWQYSASIIDSYYQQPNKKQVKNLLQSKQLYYKLKFLWDMLLRGEFAVIRQYAADFLTYSETDLALLPQKYAGYRRKIIESNNMLIWQLTYYLMQFKRLKRKK